jgi:hypothetical protein
MEINSKIKKLYNNYNYEAKTAKREFNLTIDQFKDLINQNCHYCNSPPPEPKYNGVDRVDSKLGYYPENCVTACTMCNRLKSNFKLDEFFNKIANIYFYRVAPKQIDYSSLIYNETLI